MAPSPSVAQVGTVFQPDVFETSGETICLTLPQVRVDSARVIEPATPVD